MRGREIVIKERRREEIVTFPNMRACDIIILISTSVAEYESVRHLYQGKKVFIFDILIFQI